MIYSNISYQKITIEELPRLSFGCASFGNDEAYGHINQERANILVRDAIYKHNIRYFDTSHYYGNSEKILGNALRDIPRENIFIGTKVGRVSDKSCFTREFIKQSVMTSLVRLNVSYIDLVQLHDIEFGNIDDIVDEGLVVLEELKKDGYIRYIGITGLHLDILDNIIEKYTGKIDTILTYCNFGLNYDIIGQNKLSALINEYISKWRNKGIYIIQGGFTSMGLFTDKHLPEWHPADAKTRQICKSVRDICEKYGENITKIAFQYLYTIKTISNILVGPTTIDELANYKDWIQNIEKLNMQIIDEITPLFVDFKLWIET